MSRQRPTRWGKRPNKSILKMGRKEGGGRGGGEGGTQAWGRKSGCILVNWMQRKQERCLKKKGSNVIPRVQNCLA